VKLGGPFEAYARYTDMPPALQSAPARFQSWAGVELWRWWTPPDVACGATHQFHRLTASYRAAVWTVLLVGERHANGEAAVEGGDGGGVAAVPYGAVPVEIWMLIFGFVRRDVPVQHNAME
jgi:hypothetical protein